MNIIELENLPLTPIHGKQDFFSEEKIKKNVSQIIFNAYLNAIS